MFEKIPHGSRRYMGIFLSGRYYDRLDIRSELAVCIGNRPLRLEVYHVPDATHDVPDAELAAFVDSQIVILDDADTFKACRCLPYDVDPLFIRKESSLVYIDSYCNDYFVKHGQGPLQNIEMARSKGIERSRKHSYSFHHLTFTRDAQMLIYQLPTEQ